MEGENDHGKDFMITFHENMRPDLVSNQVPLISQLNELLTALGGANQSLVTGC